MSEESDQISPTDGYRAMFEFLENYWKVGGSTEDQIANLLSSMQFSEALGPTKTMDPAMWDDWLVAAAKVKP